MPTDFGGGRLGARRLKIRTDYAAVQQAGQALNASLEKDAPAQTAALAQAKDFMQAHADTQPSLLIPLYCGMARVQYQGLLHDAPGALALLAEGLRKYPEGPDQVQNRYLLQIKQVEILVAEKRVPEADAILRPLLPKFSQTPNYMLVAWPTYTAMLAAEDKEDELLTFLHQLAKDNLSNLGDHTWISQRLIEALLKEGEADEALGWARLHFELVPYNESAINGATQLLMRAWLNKSLTSITSNAFIKAQTDPTAKNPLADVPLPTFDEQFIQAQMASVPKEQISRRITLMLISRTFRRAMLEARRLMVDNPQDPSGLQEAMRVAKAADLNLVRSNALAAYMKTGEGPNPLDLFLKEWADKEKLQK